jgi:hypothetical protein
MVMKKNEISIVLLLSVTLFSCAITTRVTRADSPSDTPSPQPSWEVLQQELLSQAPSLPAFEPANRVAASWESKDHPEREMWSQYSYTVINEYLDELDEAQDTSHFCKNYKKLDHDQKVMFWTQIFAGITRWETDWNPLLRTVEGPGLDQITGLKPVSEGLLQLSYQDMVNYPDLQTGQPYCPFNWDADKLLPVTDIHRTILNPYINLYSGIRIMSDSIVTLPDKSGTKKITYNAYWSTLGTGWWWWHWRDRSGPIKNSTEKLKFCGGHSFFTPADLLWDIVNELQKELTPKDPDNGADNG